MKKILLIPSIFILFGCATTQQAPNPIRQDQEPLLVGIPMNERVASTKSTINNQFELLNKVRTGQYAGKYEMVTHNNELDARKGARNTIPQAFNSINASKTEVKEEKVTTKEGVTIKETISSNENDKRVVKVEESCNPKLLEKVKVIVWDNDSANKLGKNFADAIGYQFVTTDNKDLNVSIKVENDSLQSAVNQFKEQLKGKAEVVIIDKNKTFNIIYKK